jgi:hypothetical protein
MRKQIHLVLGDSEIFQLLDGLEIREDCWRKTAAYLETEKFPDDEFFLIEECSNPDEARNIADDHKTSIDKIRKQLTAQQAPVTSEDILQPPKQGTTSGYAIYIDTFFQGPVAAERNESDKPIAYPTDRAAQCEIVESTIIRLEQFLAGERDFEDATTIEEYIVPVDLHRDGSITDENGNTFPNQTW